MAETTPTPQTPSTPEPLFSAGAPSREPDGRNWVPTVVGLALVIVVVIGLAVFSRTRQSAPAQADPYAQYLQVSDSRMSSADNFVGATVTYVDFTLTNTGSKKLMGGLVEATFRNTLGEIVQKEVFPMRAMVKNPLGGYDDQQELARSPIAPGKSATIRLTVEHVSMDWNQAQPDFRFLNLKVK